MKKILQIGCLSALVLLSTSCATQDWVKLKMNDAMKQYEEKDRQWTEKKFQEMTSLYEEKDRQWVENNYQQIQEAFDNTYLIINQGFFKTKENVVLPGPGGTGSSYLLKGGYLLTAKHVTGELESVLHPFFGMLEYDHSKIYLFDNSQKKQHALEEIINGSSKELDYSLLKLKDGVDLPFYSKGLNPPGEVRLGMGSVAIGHPYTLGKNVRLGNIEQLDSDAGGDYLTFKNNLYEGDSGGPLFVIDDKDGSIKFIAISTLIFRDKYTLAPVNLNYGLKVSSIIRDMKAQLKSGKLDKKNSEEINNFLKLNEN